MGLLAKREPAEIYAKLLVVYPAHYRKNYAEPMVQTFDDMLQDQQSSFGKAIVWFRALLDLPMSAAKERLTHGKDFEMNRKTKLLFGGVVVLLLLANGVSWWVGNLHSREVSGIEKVSVVEMANAMQGDYFYSTYGNAGLLFSGKAADVQTKDNTALVTFVTNRPYSVTCQFAHGGQIKQGDTLSVAAPGGSAERQPHGVLLHNCIED